MGTNIIVSLSKFDIEYLIKLLLTENQSLVAKNEMLNDELRNMREPAITIHRSDSIPLDQLYV